jgi:chromosome partitioning protein
MGAHVVGVINQKGGVGKSTITDLIAREFIENGFKTLVIDFDPQASLTKKMEGDSSQFQQSDDLFSHPSHIVRIFKDMPITPITKTIDGKEYHFVPCSNRLNSFLEATIPGKEMKLSKYIRTIADDYNVIIIDSQPALTTYMYNVILASQHIIVPVKASKPDADGLEEVVPVINNLLSDYDKDSIKNIWLIPNEVDMKMSNVTKKCLLDFSLFPDFVHSFNMLKTTKVRVMEPIPSRTVFQQAVFFKSFLRDHIIANKVSGDLLIEISNMFKKIVDDIGLKPQKTSDTTQHLELQQSVGNESSSFPTL